ncbi:hypothetical protein [Pantoea agglomerans]|uniref:hypothetical protein n=1 Tax=Enterobacter agglomerans TaxID=549 RepID=UPI001049B489|nr:hypothetical protein [Pantoea agglomerans]TCZ22841.1 hypothetical protein EYB39_21890 [Pantoea agglomerans]
MKHCTDPRLLQQFVNAYCRAKRRQQLALTEVIILCGLHGEPVDVDCFQSDHHEQIHRDLNVAIPGGWLIALTAFIGSGKTLLIQRLSKHLKNEGKVIVARSLSMGKIKLTALLSEAALFCDP